MHTTILEALLAYFSTCPHLQDKQLLIDYLPEALSNETAYCLSPISAEAILQSYADGSSMRQYVFCLQTACAYTADYEIQLAQQTFFEQLMVWVQSCTDVRNFPSLPQGKTAVALSAQSAAELTVHSSGMGKRKLIFTLQYYQTSTHSFKGEKL